MKRGQITMRNMRGKEWTPIHRETFYRQTLEKIFETLGRTCAKFPNCKHPQCADSHQAWALAELALYSTGERKSEEETQASSRFTETQARFGLLDDSRSREGRDEPKERQW